MKAKTEAQRARKAALVRKIVFALLTASILSFLAVFFAFIPFRLLLPAYGISGRREGELRLHFLDLSGGVTIAEFPDGEVLVIDAGDGSFDGDNRLCRYLRGLGARSLSVLATSSDSGHVGGMPALFEAFEVKKAYFPVVGGDSGAWKRFVSAADREGCERETLCRYGRIVNGSGAYLVCLSPYSEESGETAKEDASTLMYLSYAGVSAVISGDISARREKRLTEEYSLSEEIFDSGDCRVDLNGVDLFRAPSHGSNYASSAEWLALLKPKTTVICCNERERPSSAALERICTYSERVLRTDELGAVMIAVKDGSYEITAHVVG